MASLQPLEPRASADAPVLARPRWSTRDGLLEINVKYEHGQWMIKLADELDLSNVTTLEQELGIAEASLAERIVVDLRELGFIDSSGVHALVRAERRSRRNGGALRLTPGARRIQTVLRLTDTEEQLPFEAPKPDSQPPAPRPSRVEYTHRPSAEAAQPTNCGHGPGRAAGQAK